MRFATGDSPSSVTTGDFNSDGHQDLAVASADSNDVSILLGLGDGTFAPQMPFATGDRPISIATGDFNADGHQDLVVANTFSNDVSVLLNRSAAPDRPPMAMAGPDLRLECTSPAGATVTLDGSASSDPDSTPGTNDDIVSFDWFENDGSASQVFLGTGETLSVPVICGRASPPVSNVHRPRVARGVHLITLKVTDRRGLSSTDAVMITVSQPTAGEDPGPLGTGKRRSGEPLRPPGVRQPRP